MDTLLNWIEVNQSFAYMLLFGYCALKSGALPLLAGVRAHFGTLDVLPVILATFLGGYLGDEVRFHLARRYGGRLFASRPRWRAYVDRAGQVMQRYGSAYIFLYRYPKGMRTIGALPVGLSDIAWSRFTFLNAASAALWCALLVGLGFLLGSQLANAAENWWGTASVLLLIVFLIAAWLSFRKVSSQVFTDQLNTEAKRPL
ncbi:MAG: DedA family protein [Minwuia sp.]|uniref:DedA family protein n=1 Tax=Minwuia sp. TaxID=2493630 RepID=UPI003A8C86E5